MGLVILGMVVVKAPGKVRLWVFKGAAALVRVKFPDLTEREALKLAARISEWEHWTVHRGYKEIPLRARPLQQALRHEESLSY